MNKPKIFVHGSYIGNTGYNHHTRDFFRSLNPYADIKIRNFTIGDTWKSYNTKPHDKEPYINDVDKKMLYQQILWNNDNTRSDFPIYPDKSKEFVPDLNIVLCETNHHIFYDDYDGPKIAYNVWESTLQPEAFFNKLKEFDEFWVPSKWQRDCSIAQGYDPQKIKVVPEGIDVNVFYPERINTERNPDGRFKFFLAGRWDYRKSIKEVIETFLKTFNKEEPVDLIISVDNPFSGDGMKTTEDRLKYYGLEDERIIVKHFPRREEYIKLIKFSDAFVSCARAEGWNIPLIEAMASGTPSIYSNCSGQLEFAERRGIPVNIIGEKLVSDSTYSHFNQSIGNYYEPDFNDLGKKMRDVYENYEKHKSQALIESEQIRKEFSWENVAEVGINTINDFLNRKPWLNRPIKENKINISYLDGPKVDILGDQKKSYFVEFINGDTNEVLHSDTIYNNMWVACSKKYYIPWIIKINGFVVNKLDLSNMIVMISFESKSIGDNIAWAPYAIEFQKKHNCKVLLSTFHNNFFKGLDEYKDITFINPGETHTCHIIYRIGWFKVNDKWEDTDRNPIRVNNLPLQKTITDILGLEFKELNYGLTFKKANRPVDKEYVVFAPHSTAGCKEWDYNYWAELSKMIIDLGYDVITLTEKPFYIEGTKNIMKKPFDVVANYLYHAKAFVGLTSGLAWINWAIGQHTYMINGLTKPYHEFTTNITRIYNEDACVFCWHDDAFVFDAGDWNWCPVYKGTKKQHICQRSITPLQVFEKLKDGLN
jgi:glycosyltransferase involved in cell wall biosynthesis